MAQDRREKLTAQPSTVRNRKPFVALLAADGISQTGNMLTMLAIPWFVLETTGSAAKTGLTAAVEAIAVVVAGFLGGALVDRLGHKRTSVIGDLASAATVALIPLLHLTIGLAFWQLLILVFCGALLDTPGWAARRSLYEVVARRAEINLDRANGLAMTVNRTAGLAGPLLAGLLIATVGETNVLWLDAASFVVSAGLIALGIPARAAIVRATEDEASSAAKSGRYLDEIQDGLRFIRQDRVVFWLIVVFALGSLVAEPLYSVILPVYAKEVFGDAVDLGAMFAGLAAGSIVGNLVFLALAPKLPRRATMLVGFGVRALAFWVFVPMPSLTVMIVVIAIEAVFLEPTNPIWMSIFQERIPEALRGRVLGTGISLVYAARSIGVLGYGLLLESYGLQTTLIVLAAVNLTLPLVLVITPALREENARSPVQASEPEQALT